MRPARDTLADRFWVSLAFTGPLLALAAVPRLPPRLTNALLFTALFLGVMAMLLPLVQWARQRMAPVYDHARDVMASRPGRPARATMR